MYHQQQQQLHTHSQHLPSRPSLSPERKFLRQGQGGGDSGLILSTDAKPRLKWTSELHERFVDAVNQLGGPDKATPKTIMRVMGIPGLTLYHLKSHLQKFRLGKNLHTQATVVNVKNDKAREGQGSPAGHLNRETGTSKSMHISETLQMQIEVQRRLHEQIEVQRHLQLRIEAQGKYLHSVLEKAQEALASQRVAGIIEAEKPPEPAASPARRRRPPLQQNDGSADGSCLTAASDEGIGRRSAAAPFETPGSGDQEEKECYLFLGDPEQQQEERRRGVRVRGGRDGGVAFGAAAELGLSIGGGGGADRIIDLNGSSWND